MLDHRDPLRIHKVVARRVTEYGRLYKEKMAPGLPEMVFVCDPDDVETVFRGSGKYPQRLPMDFLRISREQLNISQSMVTL